MRLECGAGNGRITIGGGDHYINAFEPMRFEAYDDGLTAILEVGVGSKVIDEGDSNFVYIGGGQEGSPGAGDFLYTIGDGDSLYNAGVMTDPKIRPPTPDEEKEL